MPKSKQIIAMSAPVEISAAKTEGGPPRFDMTAYTGGELLVDAFELPVVVDLAGATFHKSVKANLNHERSQIVGHVEDMANDGHAIRLGGFISGGGAAADEVLRAHQRGYPWEASIQANRLKVETLARGQKATVNGQEFTGPKYIARKSTIYAVAFCDQGADDNTTVFIAAQTATNKEQNMKAEIKAWAEGMGIDVENISAEQATVIESNYEGKSAKTPTIKAANPFEARKLEAKRRKEIREYADKFVEDRESEEDEIISVEKMVDHAIEAKMEFRDFRAELIEATIPISRAPIRRGPTSERLNSAVIEAAVCESLRLDGYEKSYSDQTLQAAHDHFRNGIGLKQMLVLAAESNGYHANHSSEYSRDVLRAAFNGNESRNHRQIKAQGWSSIEISSVISNVAGKFLREGFMSVEDTWSRISTIRNVRDFKSITTISLVGDLNFEKLGAAGEIKHGTLGEVTYSNKADTYAKMLAITRQDIINDDLGALSAAPRRLGRGAATKLNDIFWTEWLAAEAAGFFSATHTTAGDTGNSNLNSGAADATIAGLTATELLFLNQVDPNGLPLGIMPKVVLVPNALKATMSALLHPQSQLITGASSTLSNVNVFAGRFRLESSAYLSNSAYSGYSAQEWYMLADPNELSAIEIAALNGRVEPTVESADADFNTLGIQMRAYGDVGVNMQEYRAAVLADGNAS